MRFASDRRSAITRRTFECGTSSKAGPAAAGVVSSNAPGIAAASTSAFRMRPFGPEPRMRVRSTLRCFAMRRASGLAIARAPGTRGGSVDAAAAAGAGTMACASMADAAIPDAGGGAVAGEAPSERGSSPAAASSPISASTWTPCVPAGTTMLASTPSWVAVTSTTALSVSTSNRTSPSLTGSPTCFAQRAMPPSVIDGATDGILISIGTPVPPRRGARLPGDRPPGR